MCDCRGAVVIHDGVVAPNMASDSEWGAFDGTLFGPTQSRPIFALTMDGAWVGRVIVNLLRSVYAQAGGLEQLHSCESKPNSQTKSPYAVAEDSSHPASLTVIFTLTRRVELL